MQRVSMTPQGCRVSVATSSHRTACQASLSSYTHAPRRRNNDTPNNLTFAARRLHSVEPRRTARFAPRNWTQDTVNAKSLLRVLRDGDAVTLHLLSLLRFNFPNCIVKSAATIRHFNRSLKNHHVCIPAVLIFIAIPLRRYCHRTSTLRRALNRANINGGRESQ